MLDNLMNDYIGKECIITMADENGTQNCGTIIGAENNWIKIEKNNVIRIINCSAVKYITINNNTKTLSNNNSVATSCSNENDSVKENNINTSTTNNIVEKINASDPMSNTVILTHGDYWYRAYNDSAYVLSFITDYKLFEESRTKRPSVGFPIDSIDNVIALLCKNKINYYLKNEDEFKDYGEENNFQKFLHRDLPFSYVSASREIVRKPVGKFVVQYENEEPVEYIIGENISDEAELTKKVINNNIGDTIIINDYIIKIIDKSIEFKW